MSQAPLTETPFVSVVVPCYNSVDTIEECLSTLEKQTYPRDRYEVILVDNGSTDGTCQLVRASYPWVKLLRSVQKGSGYARNVGLEHAQGGLILSTDADCVVDPAWVLEMVRAFATAPANVAAIGGVIVPYSTKSAVEKYRPAWIAQPDLARTPLNRRFVATPNAAFLAPILRQLGGFDGSLGFDDIDLGVRLTGAGYQLAYTDRARVRHRNPTNLHQLFRHRLKYGRFSFTLNRKHQQIFGDPIAPGALRHLGVATVRRVLADLFIKLPMALTRRPNQRPRIWPLIDAILTTGTVIGIYRQSRNAATTQGQSASGATGETMRKLSVIAPKVMTSNPMTLPFVSVVVPSYNNKHTIEDCLSSLAAQTYPSERYEVIVVDNGSADSTYERVRDAYPWVVLRQTSEKGSGYARNAGIAVAKGEFIFSTDADCLLDKAWIAQMVHAFQNADSTVAAIGGAILPYSTKTAVERYKPAWVSQPDVRGKAPAIRYTATPNAGFKASVLRAVGGFDGACGHEDTDLGIRLVLQGYRIEYTERACVYHRNPATLSELYDHRAKYGDRNYTLSKKHPRILGDPTIPGTVGRLFWATLRRTMGDLFVKLPIAIVAETKGRPRVWPVIDAAMAIGNFRGFAHAARAVND